MVEENDKIEPLLDSFKKGHSHIGVVTAVKPRVHGKDPTRYVAGIVTMEDIIEELIQDEIEDEYEDNVVRNERKVLKEKLVLYYTDHQASKVLVDNEVKACLQFLEHYVRPFQDMKRDILHVLVRRSKVVIV